MSSGSKLAFYSKKKSLCENLSLIAVFLLCIVLLLSGCDERVEDVEYKDPSMQPGEPVSAEQEFSIEDLLYTQYVSYFTMCPDGEHIAWINSGHREGDQFESHNLFISGIKDMSTVQVTDYSEVYVSPAQWSPDGKSLAYLSNAPVSDEGSPSDHLQIWSLDLGDLTPKPIVENIGGIGDFDWLGNEHIIYYAQNDDGINADINDTTVRVSDYAEAPANLYMVGKDGGNPQRISDYDENITHLGASPDGKHVMIARTKAKSEVTFTSEIPENYFLIDMETETEKQIFEQACSIYCIRWSPDSKTLYIVDGYSEEEIKMTYTCIVRALDVDSGNEEIVDLDWGRGIDAMAPIGSTSSLISPTADGFITILANGCNPKAARYFRNGNEWNKEILDGAHQGNIFSLSVSGDGKVICYDYSTAVKPAQLYAADLDKSEIGDVVQITSLNPHFEEKAVAHAETITWEGANGKTIEGMLHYPVGYEPDKKYPLVLIIHGGPFECDKDKWPVSAFNWADPYRIFSQKGAFVLTPNYQGSANYGETSADFGALMAECKFYEYPLEDIRNGIDRLVELGMVDEERLGSAGWSGGGMLTNALIAVDNRFKAASCGAGGAEWISLWGQCDFGGSIVRYYFGADPVENPSLFKDPKHAPFYDAGKVTTPTIMFTGDADYNVPASMTYVTFRGLQLHADAPTELYVFPGEPHVLSKFAHKQRKLVEEQAWFDKYLFDEQQ